MVDLQDVHREIRYLKSCICKVPINLQIANFWNSDDLYSICGYISEKSNILPPLSQPHFFFRKIYIKKKNICQCCRSWKMIVIQWKLAFRADCIWLLCGFYKGHLHFNVSWPFVVSLHWLIIFRSYIRAFVFLTAVFFQVTFKRTS